MEHTTLMFKMHFHFNYKVKVFKIFIVVLLVNVITLQRQVDQESFRFKGIAEQDILFQHHQHLSRHTGIVKHRLGINRAQNTSWLFAAFVMVV